MNNPKPNNSENVLPDFKLPKTFYPFILLILILTISMFLILYLPTSASNEETIANIFIILFVVLIIFILSITFLPNFKDLRKLFDQISSVIYVVLYTIFLIIFFRTVPSDTINNYAYIITPITLFFAGLMFYKSLSTNYILDFNINYERIKSIILLFCLITMFIIYYVTDPGGYISKYFGYTLLLTIITTIFAFLYLIIVLTLPNTLKPSTSSKSNNFLDNFSNFSVYGSIFFLIFLVITTVIIATYPGGFFTDKIMSSAVLIILLLICILWSILLTCNLFPEISDKTMNISKIDIFKKALLVLFGLTISGLIIFWLVYNIQNLSGQYGVASLILNILLVVIVMSLIYRTMNVNLPAGNSKKNGFFNLITNLLFYIPCLFGNVFDLITQFFIGEYKSTTTGSLLMLILAIIIFIIYFTMPSFFNMLNQQGGKLLVNQPVYTDSLYSLGTYAELNGSDKFNYQYAISSWIYIDSASPNTNSSYQKYTSILNFGNKPNVLYNGKTNTLMVSMKQKDLKETTNNKLTDFDENGNRIIYIKDNFLLQKWNNIIINYNGGVLDIFLNGELVKSSVGVIPYYTLDNLTIGEDTGIKGGICNVVYFDKSLTSSNIYYLYNMVKNKTPPVANESNTTILKNNLSEVESSVKETI